jgi:N-acetylglucosamine-6-phosphate deacetylase
MITEIYASDEMLNMEKPGITDVHTHGIAGLDTRTCNAGDLLRMAEYFATAGVSSFLPTIYPDTAQAMRAQMHSVRTAIEKQESLPDSHGSATAKIIGIHIEGPFLNPVKCGALDKNTFSEPSESSFRTLIDGFEDVVKIITMAPELNGAQGLIRKISDMGIVVSMGHSDATYTEAEEGFHAGAKGITHIFNAMRGFHHRDPGIAGFGMINQDVYIEVIADPYHLHPKTLEMIFRIKNPARILIVSDSVKETRETPEGAVKNSHGTLLGGSMTNARSSEMLVQMGIAEGIIRRAITENPWRYLTSGVTERRHA